MGDAGDIDVQGLQALGQGAMSAIAAPADQKQQDAMQQGDLEQMQGITSVKRDGEKTTITGTNAMIDYLHKSLMEGAQLKHHVSQVEQVLQGELQKVQNRENAYNRSPILGALANIAGNMAQAPKMPGVVQALGRSSVQLNPGPLAIQGQKMNILEALDQAHRTSVADERADFGQNLALAQFGLSEARENRLEEHGKAADQRQAFMSMASAAGKGEVVDPKITRETLKSLGIDDAKADAFTKQLVATSEQARTIELQKQSATDERQRAGFAEQEKLLGKRLQGMVDAVNARQEKTKTESDKKTEQAEFMKAAPTLKGLNELETSIDKLETMVKKYPWAQGVIEGRIPYSRLSQEQARFKAAFFYNLSGLKDSIGAGVRFWNPTEFSNISPLLERSVKTQTANLGTIKATHDFITNNRSALVSTYGDVDWSDPKRKRALGTDAEPILAERKKYMDEAEGKNEPPILKTKRVNGRIVILKPGEE